MILKRDCAAHIGRTVFFITDKKSFAMNDYQVVSRLFFFD